MAPRVILSQPAVQCCAVLSSASPCSNSARCQAARLPLVAGQSNAGRLSVQSSKCQGLKSFAFLRWRNTPVRFAFAPRLRSCNLSHQMPVATAVTASAKPHTDSFENVTTEEELLAGIKTEIEARRLPSKAGPGMEMFWRNYRDAVLGSKVENAMELAVKTMAMVFDRIMVQFEDPFTFPSYHKRITEPYNYYNFGQDYVRPLIDFKNSYLGNPEIFDDIDRQLSEGHNVVLLANHQTEADPAVLALLLETSHPRLATELTYVAGDRVVLDPFCKPFSMGRNLLCVFSKKRINDIPELAEQKMAANRRTLKEMALLFRKGGNLIWIAPSGGRDRPDPETDEWSPAPFDSSAVEMMRRLLLDAGVPGHLYPMALVCYDIMPPPRTIEKELGEVRMIGHHGVATSVGPAMDFQEVAGHVSDRKEAREVFSKAVFDSVVKQYQVLGDAVHGTKGLGAATEETKLAQAWMSKSEETVMERSQQQAEPTPAAAAR